jgi:hypothetical protein
MIFITTLLLFLPLHLLFEIPRLLFNRRPHVLLRVWHLTCQLRLHRDTSRQDLRYGIHSQAAVSTNLS